MAPPIPVNEEIKPTIKPKTVFKNKFNLSFIFASSFWKKKFTDNVYKTKAKTKTKDLVWSEAAT